MSAFANTVYSMHFLALFFMQFEQLVEVTMLALPQAKLFSADNMLFANSLFLEDFSAIIYFLL